MCCVYIYVYFVLLEFPDFLDYLFSFNLVQIKVHDWPAGVSWRSGLSIRFSNSPYQNRVSFVRRRDHRLDPIRNSKCTAINEMERWDAENSHRGMAIASEHGEIPMSVSV